MKPLAYLLAALCCASATSAQQAPALRKRPGQEPRAEVTPRRVQLAPRFAPGQVLHYQTEFRTTTEGHRSGLVEDPQAPSKLEISWGAVVRVEVLAGDSAGVKPGPDAPGRVPTASEAGVGVTRLRTSYEKSVATTHSDTFDPEGAAIEEQYRKLEGRTIEFTLDAEGRVSEVKGLEEILADEKAAHATREWLGQFGIGAELPREGILPGKRWSSEQPAPFAPLEGLVWRTESTYLRDEPCRPAGVADDASRVFVGESCAVLLTRFEVLQPRASRDPTPQEYRKRGLRTAGTWSGSGESLSYISLRTGWVVSITQSGMEEMDVTVSTADGESSVRYAGRVRSQSQVTLLLELPPTSP